MDAFQLRVAGTAGPSHLLRRFGPVDEAFSPAAQRAIVIALEEARIAGAPLVTAGHLVLGLVRMERSAAGKALSSAGLTLDQARTFLREQGGEQDTQLEFSVGARKILEWSWQIALRKGSEEIRPEHLLEAVLDSKDRKVTEVFRVCEISANEVRSGLAELIGEEWLPPEQVDELIVRVHRTFEV